MEQQTFSQKMKRLEDIVGLLESTDIELEQGLKLLEEGIALHKQCQTILTESQARITTLLKADQPVSEIQEAVELPDESQPMPDPEDQSPNQNELPF